MHFCNNPNYVSNAKYWNSIDSTNLLAAGLWYNTCYPNVPYGGPGIYQNPKSGGAYLRSQVYCTSPCSYYFSRSYAKNLLKSTLTNAVTYCVKMHVNLENASPYAISSLQIYLSDNSIDTTKYCGMPLTYLTPQITNTLGIVTDTVNWVEISGTFVSNGSEKYLTIGNFNSNATTSASSSTTGATTGGIWSEYMIDDVSVIDFNLPAYAGPDQNIMLGDSAFIGRPPEIGLDCIWTTGTSTVGTGGGIWVKPSTTGTYSYVVTQNICGNIKTDTVNVNISSGLKSENEVFAENISIYPQPTEDVITIGFNHFYEPTVSVSIHDLTGKTLREIQLNVNHGKAIFDLSQFVNGVYFIEISSNNNMAVKKLVISK
jgi:hypothetical protein